MSKIENQVNTRVSGKKSGEYGITVNEADGRFLQEDRHPPGYAA